LRTSLRRCTRQSRENARTRVRWRRETHAAAGALRREASGSCRQLRRAPHCCAASILIDFIPRFNSWARALSFLLATATVTESAHHMQWDLDWPAAGD
jgi:hypothetical protein